MLRLLCLLVGLAATVHGACDLPFHQVGEGCYYFSLEVSRTATWTEALQDCQDLGTDVTLAVMDTLCNDFTNLVTYILVADAFYNLYPMWVGARGSEEIWTWVDGRSLSVSSPHWYYSQPTGSGCVYLSDYTSNGWTKIQLFETACTASYYYICQKDGDALH